MNTEKKLLFFIVVLLYGFDAQAMSKPRTKREEKKQKHLNKAFSSTLQQVLKKDVPLRAKHKKKLDGLLAQGAHIKGRALPDAATRNHTDLIRYLVEHKADINQDNEILGTALSSAVVCKNYLIIEFLLAHGADPNLPTQGRVAYGLPFHKAFHLNDERSMYFLLAYGATVDFLENDVDIVRAKKLRDSFIEKHQVFRKKKIFDCLQNVSISVATIVSLLDLIAEFAFDSWGEMVEHNVQQGQAWKTKPLELPA